MPAYRIRHTTHYRYSAPVYLEPHRALLVPRETPALKITSHALHVEPTPSGRAIIRDAEDNTVHALWFSAGTSSLRLESDIVVEPLDFNPFNFLIYPIECAYLPFRYPAAEVAVLAPYLDASPASAALQSFVNRVVQANGGQTVMSLLGLCTKMSRDFASPQEKGPPRPPEETLSLKSGTCRDFAVLFIAAARALGVAARFVSGYTLNTNAPAKPELHAWAEVYLPGAGWMGFDPTQGIAIGSGHIATAVAASPQHAAPIQGAFRGNATASVTFEIDIAAV